jgi:hypothetical protein
MKKALLTLCVALLGATSAMAGTVITVKDSISSNTTWTKDNQYLLQGYVYVTSGATLTIEAGTIIKGDKATKGALIIERGAKIMAVGTATMPIVFTSNQPAGSRTYGDWGGVILCGKAPTNWSTEPTVEGGPRSKYGGTDPHDNSGQMSYVRIEFPGIAFSPNNEVNGLTFCGVGDATVIDHIQVSYSGDDAYEFFGGNVNTKYMVAHRSWDDDFDTDNGYQGKNQFGVVLRDPFAADQSGSKAFESDSYQPGGVTYSGVPFDASKVTSPVFANFTVVGPLVSPTSTAWDPQFVAGVHLRRGSGMSLLNSIIMGWPAGVLVDEAATGMGTTTGMIGNGTMVVKNNVFAGNASYGSPTGNKDAFYVINGARSLTPTTSWGDTTATNPVVGAAPFAPTYAGPYDWLLKNNKTYSTAQTGVRLQTPFNLVNPDFHPTSTSPLAFNAAGNGSKTAGFFDPTKPINTDTSNGWANYNVPQYAPDSTNSKLSGGFFSKVNHVGAFSGDVNTSWMTGWTNFDPQNTNYPLGGVAVQNVAKNILNAKVVPNPASNNAVLTVELAATSNLQIAVADITGKTVISETVNNVPAGTQSFAINVAELNTGMYFVNLYTANGTKSVKLNVVK